MKKIISYVHKIWTIFPGVSIWWESNSVFFIALLSDWHLVLYTCGIPTLISDEAIERVNLDTIPRYYNLGSSIEFNYVVIFTNCLCCITQCSYVVDVNWKLKVR